MSAVGRNAPCPCGSGKKHKNCCLNAAPKTSFGNRIVFSVIAALLIGGAFILLTNLDQFSHSEGGPTRVWSEEHGHWH